MPRILDQDTGHTMSFGDHLEELRKRVFLALAAPIPLAVIALIFSNTLIEVLLLPLFNALDANDLPLMVQALGPAEVIFIQLKLSIIVAIIASSPWILWQAWLFISPGLFQHEKRFVHLLIPGSIVLTIAGVLMLYYALLPVMLAVMINIGSNVHVYGSNKTPDAQTQAALNLHHPLQILYEAPANPAAGDKWLVWPDFNRGHIAVAGAEDKVEERALPVARDATISQQYRISEYIDFVLVLALGTVIGFQMPLVVMLLGWIGIATPEWFRKQRRYALFGCALASAVITPSSDIVSMLVLMLPLYLLYELGILLLVLAPAKKVAEGRVFSLPRWRWRRSDKSSVKPARSAKALQTDRAVPRPSAGDEAQEKSADREEVRR
jgi:Tat protein translocase TatC